MDTTCSLHCGHFSGVAPETFEANRAFLEGLFKFTSYDPKTGCLEVTGAQGLSSDPDALIAIFNALSGLLSDTGKGRLMLQCDAHEVCYFRRSMWKLMAVQIPADPFDDIHLVAG